MPTKLPMHAAVFHDPVAAVWGAQRHSPPSTARDIVYQPRYQVITGPSTRATDVVTHANQISRRRCASRAAQGRPDEGLSGFGWGDGGYAMCRLFCIEWWRSGMVKGGMLVDIDRTVNAGTIHHGEA